MGQNPQGLRKSGAEDMVIKNLRSNTISKKNLKTVTLFCTQERVKIYVTIRINAGSQGWNVQEATGIGGAV